MKEKKLYDGETAVGAVNDPTAIIPSDHAVTHLGQAWSQPEDIYHYPDTIPPAAGDESWRVTWQHVAMIGGGAIAVAAVAVAVGSLVGTDGPSQPVTSVPPPVTIIEPAPSTSTSTVTQTAPPPEVQVNPETDPEAAALLQLQAYQAGPASTSVDRITVDSWVPQLSSKHVAQPWTYDKEDGVTYDSVQTLAEYEQLRARYKAILLWSGDWPGYTERNDWIVIAPVKFDTRAGALGWCADHGLDTDHCYAENLYTGHTAY